MTGEEHEAIESLLGAYVLDAVDPDELWSVEQHLEVCPRCRAEVDALREVAGAIGNTAVPVPPHLWDRIAERLGDAGAEEHPPPRLLVAPVVAIDGARRARAGAHRPWWFAAGTAAAAAVVAIALLSAGLVDADHRLDQQAAGPVPAAVASALRLPGHEVGALRTSAGALAARLVVAPDGRGYLYDTHMADLPSDKTYQLWGLIGGRAISLALLGPSPSGGAFTVASATPTVLMVTVEPAGGVPTPTTGPVAQGGLTSA